MFLFDTDGELTDNLSWISRSVTNHPQSLTFDITDDYIDINETWNPPVSQFDLHIIYTLPHLCSLIILMTTPRFSSWLDHW